MRLCVCVCKCARGMPHSAHVECSFMCAQFVFLFDSVSDVDTIINITLRSFDSNPTNYSNSFVVNYCYYSNRFARPPDPFNCLPSGVLIIPNRIGAQTPNSLQFSARPKMQ